MSGLHLLPCASVFPAVCSLQMCMWKYLYSTILCTHLFLNKSEPPFSFLLLNCSQGRGCSLPASSRQSPTLRFVLPASQWLSCTGSCMHWHTTHEDKRYRSCSHRDVVAMVPMLLVRGNRHGLVSTCVVVSYHMSLGNFVLEHHKQRKQFVCMVR